MLSPLFLLNDRFEFIRPPPEIIARYEAPDAEVDVDARGRPPISDFGDPSPWPSRVGLRRLDMGVATPVITVGVMVDESPSIDEALLNVDVDPEDAWCMYIIPGIPPAVGESGAYSSLAEDHENQVRRRELRVDFAGGDARGCCCTDDVVE